MADKKKKIQDMSNLGHHFQSTLKSIDQGQRNVSRTVNQREKTRERITKHDVESMRQYKEIKQENPKSYEAKIGNSGQNHQAVKAEGAKVERPQYQRGDYKEPVVQQKDTIVQNTGPKPNKVDLKTTEVKHQEVANRLQTPKRETLTVKTSNLESRKDSFNDPKRIDSYKMVSNRERENARQNPGSGSLSNSSYQNDKTRESGARSVERSSTPIVRKEGTIVQNTEARPNKVELRTTDVKHQEVAQRIQSPRKETIGVKESNLGTAKMRGANNHPGGLSQGKQNAQVSAQGNPILSKGGSKNVPGFTKQETVGVKGTNGLKTSTGMTVGKNQGTDLKNLSKSMQTGEFQQRVDPNTVLQTRVTSKQAHGLETLVKGKEGIGAGAAGAFVNNPDEIQNLERMMSRAKFDGLLDADTKKEILEGLKNGNLSVQEVRNLLKSAQLASKNGIYIKDKNGKILSAGQVRTKGMANKLIGGKNAGIGKVSKGATIGLKGVGVATGAATKIARLSSAAMNAAMTGVDDDVVNYAAMAANKVKTKVKNKAKNKVTGTIKKGTWKVAKKSGKLTYRVGKKATTTVVKAMQASIQFVKALLIKLVGLCGGIGGLIFIPTVLCIGIIACVLSVFTGSAESKETFGTFFSAQTSEFSSRRSDKLDELEKKKQPQPAKSLFENISDEDYTNLINTQYIPDTVTTEGSSQIDYKAQMSLFQGLSGASEMSDETVKGDFLTVFKYWDEQGIVESYDTSTASYPYTVYWKAKKQMDVNETAKGKTSGEAIDKAKQKCYAHATDGYTIVNKKDIRAIKYEPVYKKVPIYDDEGEKTGEYKEVLDYYTATVAGTMKLEKEMSRELTQYIYTLHIENGDLDDYLNLSQKAYKDNVTLSIGNYELGKEMSGTTVVTDGTTKKNMEAIWKFLKKNGFTDEAAAGVMGNIQGESGFNPKAVEGNGEGHGIIQWSFDRKTRLFNMAAERGTSWDDLGLQLDLFLQEFKSWNFGGYFNSSDDFKKSKDINKTTEAFMIKFEAPADQSQAHINRRIGFAKGVYDQLKGSSGKEDTNSIGRAIWVGDSRTHGMQSAISSGDNQWICKDSMGYNWFVSDVVPQVNSQLKDGDTIVFNFGVNDLGNVNKYINKLNELASGAWKKAKQILVMSVNPVDEAKASGYGYSVKNKDIESFNSKMKSGLKQGNLKFFDTYSKLQNNMETTDGIHYNSETYRKIYDMVRGGNTNSSTVNYGSKIKISNRSKHFGKSFYYEELISQQFLINKPKKETDEETETDKKTESRKKKEEEDKNESSDPSTEKNEEEDDSSPSQNGNLTNTKTDVDRKEIPEDLVLNIKTLYDSKLLMEDFDIAELQGGSSFGSFGFNGSVKNPIKEESTVTEDTSIMYAPGNPFAIPQCTWFAWARFYQVYGYDSGARGHGKYNAQQVVNAHPDKFEMSSTPAPGSVFSVYSGPSIIPAYGHVGFVEAVEGDTMWITEGNVTINGKTGQMWFHKVSVSQWLSQHQAEFAVPKKKTNEEK